MSQQSSIGDLSDLLPRRALLVRPPASAGGGTIGVVLLLLVVLAGVLGTLGPSILADWRMRGETAAAADLRVRDTQCRSWLGVLRFCSVTLEPATNDGTTARTLRYAFFGTASDRGATALRGTADPSQVTTNLGLDHVRGRLMALLLLAGVVLCCLGVAAAVLWRDVKARRGFSALSGRCPVPVVVEIERNNRLPPRRRLWVYVYEVGGRRERALAEWPSKRQPLFTTPDERWALALRSGEGGIPLLLDVEVADLDLTDAEKADFRKAFMAKFGIGIGSSDAGAPR